MGKTLRNFRARPVRRLIERLTKKTARIEIIGNALDLPILELRERDTSAGNAPVCHWFARWVWTGMRSGPRPFDRDVAPLFDAVRDVPLEVGLSRDGFPYECDNLGASVPAKVLREILVNAIPGEECIDGS